MKQSLLLIYRSILMGILLFVAMGLMAKHTKCKDAGLIFGILVMLHLLYIQPTRLYFAKER